MHFLFKIFRTKHLASLLKAYVSYIRPLLEYNSPVWSPCTVQNIDKLEKVQKLFTRILFKRCNLDRLEYKERLQHLDIESLEKRRRKADLCLCFAILKNIYHVDSASLFTRSSSSRTRGHDLKLQVPKIRLNIAKHNFAFRVVKFWNMLSSDTITNSVSLRRFKSQFLAHSNIGRTLFFSTSGF